MASATSGTSPDYEVIYFSKKLQKEVAEPSELMAAAQ